MSQDVEQYLTDLARRWTPPEGHFAAHTRHRAAIQQALELRCGIFGMFETGSLRHGTAIRKYSDADYFVSMMGNRPSPGTALLNVKDALQGRFQYTSVQTRRPAVKCLFANGTETVEIVPAYPIGDGDYWIPDPDGTWMRSNPKNHNEYVNAANKDPLGSAKRLARLAKVWKYQRQVPVSSFYLEMRAAQYVNGITTWLAWVDLPAFFNSLESHELADMNDPSGQGARISACSSAASKREALSKLSTAASRARRAKKEVGQGYDAAAQTYFALLFDI